jgi:hypothetical protein
MKLLGCADGHGSSKRKIVNLLLGAWPIALLRDRSLSVLEILELAAKWVAREKGKRFFHVGCNLSLVFLN